MKEDLTAVLLSALAGPADDALEGILAGIRHDLEVAARLAEGSKHYDVACSIDGLGRRLDVAIELRRRELRTRPLEGRKKKV